MRVVVARSWDFRFGLLLAVGLSCSMWPAASQAYTGEQQQACMGDAFRLCGAEIPDVDRVTACMVRRQVELSPGCRVYFRPEPPLAAARPLGIRAHARKLRKHRRHVEEHGAG